MTRATLIPEREVRAADLRELVEGKSGVEQPRRIRRMLRAFEHAGVARFTAGGWYLTQEGRELLDPALVDPVVKAHLERRAGEVRAAAAERRTLTARADRREELHRATRGHGAMCPCDACAELRRI